MTIAGRDDGGRCRAFSWVASRRRTSSAPQWRSVPESGRSPRRRERREDWASRTCCSSNGDDDGDGGGDDGDRDGGHGDGRDDDDGDDIADRVGRRWRSHCS